MILCPQCSKQINPCNDCFWTRRRRRLSWCRFRLRRHWSFECSLKLFAFPTSETIKVPKENHCIALILFFFSAVGVSFLALLFATSSVAFFCVLRACRVFSAVNLPAATLLGFLRGLALWLVLDLSLTL